MMFRPSWVSALSSRRLRRGGLHLHRLGEQRLDLAGELGLGHAFLGADADQVELALLLEQPLGGLEIEDGDGDAAQPALDPKRTMPLIS